MRLLIALLVTAVLLPAFARAEEPSIKNGFDEVGRAIEEDAKKGWDATKDVSKEGWDKTKQGVGTAMEKTGEGIDKAADGIKHGGEKVSDK